VQPTAVVDVGFVTVVVDAAGVCIVVAVGVVVAACNTGTAGQYIHPGPVGNTELVT
jgi:predicted small secreted protein